MSAIGECEKLRSRCLWRARKQPRAWGYSHATFSPPASSRHLQALPSTRVTQLQVGFSAHSVSQLQALAFSSQYQPEGQMLLPHMLQVPSSQLGPLAFSGAAALSLLSLSASLLGRALSWLPLSSVPADLASPVAAVPAPQPEMSRRRAKPHRKGRILRSVYVS